MPMTTYYVVRHFTTVDGATAEGEPFERPDAEAAKRSAEAKARGEGAGAIAFTRSVDPSTGDFTEVEILATYGVVPEELN